MNASLFALLAVSVVACAETAPPTRPTRAVPPPRASGASPPAPAPSSTSPASRGEPPLPASALGAERVLDARVRSIAFGKKRMAALGDEAFIDVGQGFEKMPHPPAPLDKVEIYFGRDDWPRLMGAGETATASTYLRFKQGAWKQADYELGKLGADSGGPLFGVLGHADPEVVCKAEGCIVKRLTGWTPIDAPAPFVRVVLAGDATFAFEGAAVWSLTATGFVALPGPKPSFERADALFALGPDRIWVAEHGTGKLHLFDGHAWTASMSPIRGPRGLYADSKDSVYVVGDGGAAHFERGEWSAIPGIEGALTVAARSPTEVFVGAGRGLYRLR